VRDKIGCCVISGRAALQFANGGGLDRARRISAGAWSVPIWMSDPAIKTLGLLEHDVMLGFLLKGEFHGLSYTGKTLLWPRPWTRQGEIDLGHGAQMGREVRLVRPQRPARQQCAPRDDQRFGHLCDTSPALARLLVRLRPAEQPAEHSDKVKHVGFSAAKGRKSPHVNPSRKE
jgi:hypothetical protein